MTSAVATVLAAALAATLAACSPASGGDGADAVQAPVAVVGDARISKADLSDFVYERFRERWFEALDEMVDERILVEEQRRLGVVVPSAALDAAVEAEAKAREAQLRTRFGDGTDLAASVREHYGLDLAAWRRDVLRPRLRTHLLLQRAVRLSARTREQVTARVVVVGDRAKAQALRAKIDRGADFSLTALQESEHATRALGGALPVIARGDLVVSAVEDALFAAAPGSVVGPLEVRGESRVEWHVYKVVERTPPWTGDPAALLPRLEADLGASPVGRGEYERWASRVRRAYGVRTFAPDGQPLRLPGGSR